VFRSRSCGALRRHRRGSAGASRCSRLLFRLAPVCLALAASLVLGVGSARSHYVPGEPPNIDPGTPTFTGVANPVPAEPVAFDPTKNMLQAIFEADVAAGGTSYWFDRILARPETPCHRLADQNGGRPIANVLIPEIASSQ